MTLDEAYKLKGYAQTQIEIWQSQLRQANQVIQADLDKKREILTPKVPVTPDTNHCEA